jgi:hypothetical protein
MQEQETEEQLTLLAVCSKLVSRLSHPDLLTTAHVTLGPVQQLLATHNANMQALRGQHGCTAEK